MREQTGAKITIVIPVYKVESYLRQCLDSVVNQTYQNMEIIAVDDGSPDHCGAICDEYAKKDKRIIVLHKQNAGVSAARNDGIATATGMWIMFVDSDDWLEYDFVENMLAVVPDAMTDIVFSGGYILEFPTKSKRVYALENDTADWKENKKLSLYAKTLAPWFLTGNPQYNGTIAMPWNKLFRTAFLKQNGIFFNTELHPNEDILFCLNAIEKAASFFSTYYIGYHYRQGIKTSSLHRYNPNWPHMAEVFLPRLKSFVNSWPEEEILQEALDARTMVFVSQIMQCYFFHPNNTKDNKIIKQELNQFKNMPTVKRAIWASGSKKFTWRQNILRYVLRLPWIWPTRLLCLGKEKLKGQ